MQKPRKAPKKISKTYLENAALHYLQRYASSSANFRKVMMRKVKRSCQHHGQDPGEFAPLVEDLVRRYVEVGLMDDAAYAKAKTSSLRRTGKSRQAIQAKLHVKGLRPDEIEAALTTVDAETEDPEYAAALTLARKKKLGSFRIRPAEPQKELATLARAGFSYDVARRVLDWDGDDDAS